MDLEERIATILTDKQITKTQANESWRAIPDHLVV